ncbi:MAG: hypothetical protein ACLQVF_24390, partial [Isosphaeraceae bacterium]
RPRHDDGGRMTPASECFQVLTEEVCKKFDDYGKQNEGFHLIQHLGWTDFARFNVDLLSLQ